MPQLAKRVSEHQASFHGSPSRLVNLSRLAKFGARLKRARGVGSLKGTSLRLYSAEDEQKMNAIGSFRGAW